MNLMLAAIVVWVALGVLAPRFGRREQFAAYAVAVVITGLYFLYPIRYM